jgi:hypothetical protein
MLEICSVLPLRTVWRKRMGTAVREYLGSEEALDQVR